VVRGREAQDHPGEFANATADIGDDAAIWHIAIVADPVAPPELEAAALSPLTDSGAIEIEFATGARMRITCAVDAATLEGRWLMDGGDDPAAGRRARVARDRLAELRLPFVDTGVADAVLAAQIGDRNAGLVPSKSR
jgi:hypothetical protein